MDRAASIGLPFGQAARAIFRLSLPLAAFQLGSTLLGVVDSMVVGRVGAAELGAVALGNMLQFTFVVFGMGIVFGIEPLVAQAAGARENPRAWGATRTGLAISAALTPPLLVALLLVPRALPWFDVDARVVELCEEYLWARAPGVPALLLYTAVRGYLQGYDVTRPVVIGIVVANLLNVPADIILVFGDRGLVGLGLPALGFSGWGVVGAGVASTVAAFVQLLVALAPALALGKEHAAEGPVPAVAAGRVLRVGVPVGLQYVAEVGIFALVGIVMGRLGATDLAAHQIALTLGSISFRVTLGISSATAVIVGKQVGARDAPGSLRAGLAGLGLAMVVMSCSGTLFFFFPELLARAFTDDPEVIARSVVLIRVAAAFQLSDGLQAVAGGALRGGGDTSWAFGINLVAYWVLALPLALYWTFSASWGAVGLWWGLTAGLSAAAVGQVTRFVYRARQGYDVLAT